MANPEHIKWLLEGVESWNARRQDEAFVPDLSGEDIASRLRDAQITASTGQPDLTGVNLSGARLGGCKLSGVFLTGANLVIADLTRARLLGADLTGADLIGAKLGQANLSTCKLVGARVGDADLERADLTGSRPWQASMESRFSTSLMIGSSTALTASITSINDLLQQFKLLQNYYTGANLQNEVVFYFRGESNDTWKLSPSVMRRLPADKNSLQNAEGDMLVDLQSRRAEDFVEANSALDQMVVAQHHGLPTRLLDITRNPLVALFHASEDWNESEISVGRIHVFAVPNSLVKPFDSDTATVIANFARLRRNEQNLLLGKREEDTKDDAEPGYGAEPKFGNQYTLAMNRLYQFIRLEKPSFQERIDPKDMFRVIVAEPRQSFERIRAQSGAFLISAFHERFEEEEVRKLTADIPLYHHYTLPVPGNCKDAINEELATLNITRETMFPGLDEAAKAVTDYYRRP